MEDTSKANIVFNISGGNNQILPNAISKQSLRAVLRTLIKIYTFAPNFKFGTK